MSLKSSFLIILLFHSTFAFHGCFLSKKTKIIKSSTIIEEKVEIIEVVDTVSYNLYKDTNLVVLDTFQTSLAEFISGKNKSYFDSIIEIDKEFWTEFSEEINKDFSKIQMRRLDKMSNWVGTDFLDNTLDTCLLFYPFSGPDFLHANYLYPNANEYVLLALEKVGHIPEWNKIGSRQTRKYLENINHFLRDIYLRSYFITKHMNVDIEDEKKINGVLPALYWFIARTGYQIISMERITLDKNGNIVRQENNKGLEGVRFKIIKKGSEKVQKLIYFCCDISNDGFEEENPELLTYLNNLRTCNTFVKSASYLMHYRSFSKIRNIVLPKSKSIFQDDTGIPFKYVNNDSWKIKHYGSYVKPIKDFESVMHIIFQDDLVNVYKNQKMEKLPFSLGYHWREASDQNQMLLFKSD